MFSLVDQWKTSGVTQKAFCAEQAINTHTFSYWVAKLRRADQPSGGFAAVEVPGAGPSDRITITYPNGVAICLSSGIIGFNQDSGYLMSVSFLVCTLVPGSNL